MLILLRGLRKRKLGGMNDVISDYSEIIYIEGTFLEAFYNGGNAKTFELIDFFSAISDYTKLIQWKSRAKRVSSVYIN